MAIMCGKSLLGIRDRAVTWGNGAAGIIGAVPSAANSLVGSAPGDSSGAPDSSLRRSRLKAPAMAVTWWRVPIGRTLPPPMPERDLGGGQEAPRGISASNSLIVPRR